MLRPQPHSLLLESRLIGLQPRAAALDLPVNALYFGASSRIGPRQPGRAEPLKFRSVGLQLRRLPLDLGTTPLELSAVGLMMDIPSRGC